MPPVTVTVTSYTDARDAFRSRHLRQALYDEGEHLMAGVVVNLHGDEHVARRRLERRLFRPDVFAWYERERIPAIVAPLVARSVAAGRADLVDLARTTMLTLSIDVAGLDRPLGTDDELARIHGLMQRLARASTVAHATGDKGAIVADGDAALAEVEAWLYEPSLTRRRDLVARVERGELDEAALPRDVLTTLVRNQDRLELPAATVLRETAYFPWVGSHSTSNAFVHAMHHTFDRLASRPHERAEVASGGERLQQFVHESLRLHPASPVAVREAVEDVTLGSVGVAARAVAAGTRVVIDVGAANRDPAAVGDDPERFDPDRRLAPGVAPWGLTFGFGPHACLGAELAGGRVPGDEGEALAGAIVVMAAAVLAAGAERDPEDPPVLDTTTTRQVWARYPVRFS